MKKYYIIAILLMLLSFYACERDILDKFPENQVTEQNFFKNADDLRLYMNGFYDGIVLPGRYSLSEIYYTPSKDNGSDMILLGRNAVGTAPNGPDNTDNTIPNDKTTNDAWNNPFKDIHKINFFFANNKTTTDDALAAPFIGEAHYIRAQIYFSFMRQFGAVPLIKVLLDDQSGDGLYPSRVPRNEVADYILADLDTAIMLLKPKIQSEPGRINLESALTLKSRIALFEGTWERYHQGSVLGVSGQDGNKYLQKVGPTVEQLIAIQGDNIFRGAGPTGAPEPYNQLRTLYNMHSTPGVFLYREYNSSLQSGQQSTSWLNAFESTRTMCATRRLVDMYLSNTGMPQDYSQTYDYTLNELGQNLDPRFRQTIWTPDRFDPTDPSSESFNKVSVGNRGVIDAQADGGDYPNLDYQITGFRIWKSVIYEQSQYRAADTDDIVLRYAEALLNYAEAAAILGNFTQEVADKTVNVLRSRVGMAPMDVATVSGWNVTYDDKMGFDTSESNLVNEIRRERNVELALEGFRTNDLRRWNRLVNVIDGYIPEGANYADFYQRFSSEPNLQSTRGVDKVGEFSDGLINPLSIDPNFGSLTATGMVMAAHRYLSPIPQTQIDLYEEKNKTLEQNPGWEGGPSL